ncbi:kinase-like protein [Westerdykella ornata]|uniref:non-specific serine/threonine protein kinase n=1 Tax=Westerdykella ornata TaxID=318751 RepID=A0A6A6JU03_WESOR|nr:kinase-like protein [Westerdykella ornata]KAF2280081.1 kinase-like protein [Westerdykella ornata]
MSSDASTSEGEIVESPHKANTATSRPQEPGIDNSSRGFGLDGTSDAYDYRRRALSRSPSPYRHKRDPSPSPYRHRRSRSRSPSPYRHHRDGRNYHERDSRRYKRRATPPRHGRPDKRQVVGRGDVREYRSQKENARMEHSEKPKPLSYADNEHYAPIPSLIPSFEASKPATNGASHKETILHQKTTSNKENASRMETTSHSGSSEATPAPANHDETEYTLEPVVQEQEISEETREERRRRWAAKRAQLSSRNTPLLEQAVTNAATATQGHVAQPLSSLDTSVASSPRSPQVPDMESTPVSPMDIDKRESLSRGPSPQQEGPSAANYDPTQDMLEDRVRAEQKNQQQGMAAADYDETSSRALSTLPAEKAGPAQEAGPAKKKRKKEIDMFAESDEEEEENEDGEEEEDAGQPKGTVLDEKLLDNWDDANGYYKIISNELINSGRYRVIKYLGRGVFANVVSAEDVKEKRGQLVAIKIVRRNEAMKKASQKEIDFVLRLNEADQQDKKHIVRYLGSFDHKGHFCIVFEYMQKNLRDLLKEDARGAGLPLPAVKAYARQMFIGLKHLQDCQIVHADLKPDNILVSQDNKTLKLCDLGTAADKRDNTEPTPYLVSRFYRAPEIILGMDIGYPIDMWAIGCTIYELWTGKILFPGGSNNQMIKVFMECLGWPSEKHLKKGLLSGQHFEPGPPLKFISREVDQFGKPFVRKIEQQRMPSRPLKTRVAQAAQGSESPSELNDLTDLLAACLHWNPEKRIQPKDAINHKLFVKPTMAPRSAVIRPAIGKRPYGAR